jgi:branched-chain amino acid transport system substrate-binding protein
VNEVLLGYFGPSDPANPEGGDLWCAAQLAIEEVNREGGFRGKPFRLIPGWSSDPWGTGVARVVRMVYEDRVWAIIGGIDGPSTHLAEQVVAKARLALVSPASSDKTVNLANVPWMFSCLPGDHVQTPVLAAEIRARVGTQPVVLVSADDHDSRLFTRELLKALREHRIAPDFHFVFQRGEKNLADQIERIAKSDAGAVIVVANAKDSARLVCGLRQSGLDLPVFGGPAMGRRGFLEHAGAAAEGVIFPLLYLPRIRGKITSAYASPPRGRGEGEGAEKAVVIFPRIPSAESEDFHELFRAKHGHSPDYAAAHAYDAVCLLVAAIRKAGLNRTRIRDSLVELSPWRGVTGEVQWDPTGSNTRPVTLGTFNDGRIVPLATSRSRGRQTDD